MADLTFYSLSLILCLFPIRDTFGLLQTEIVYKWDEFEIKWPNDSYAEKLKESGKYLNVNNVLGSVKVYKQYTFAVLTTRKNKVPFTLAVIELSVRKPELNPYPNWDYYSSGNCKDLLFVSSISIDPDTGYMWIVDTSAHDTTSGKCSPKIVIYDIDKRKEVHRHIFPIIVIGYGSVFLNDIILDYKDNETQYAYITDALDYKLIAYNRKLDRSYYFTHPSMEPEMDFGNDTMCNSTVEISQLGISSITISSDYEFVYYSTAGGLTIYQIQTSVLRDYFSNSITFASSVHEAGTKLSRGIGLAYGKDHHLYYSSYEGGNIYKWSIGLDAKKQGSFDMVFVETQSLIVSELRVKWIQWLWLDNEDHLWFISNNFKCSDSNSNKSQSNYYVWRTSLTEVNYSILNKKNNTNTASIHYSASNIFIIITINFLNFYIPKHLLIKG